MQRNFEELTTELIRLPKRDRLEIVRFLLFLDDRSEDIDDVESSWEEEITRRVRAVETGSAIGVDYKTAIHEIERQNIFSSYTNVMKKLNS